MTLLSGALIWLFRRWLGKRRGAVAAALGIAAYTLLVGASAAVVRAAILSRLSLLARQGGRRQEAVNKLAFTGALMTLHNTLLVGAEAAVIRELLSKYGLLRYDREKAKLLQLMHSLKF